MKPSAVVPLMYESWEYRPTDVDLQACRARGITVAGTNERHPDVDVFSFLGQMAVMQLHDAGIAVRGSRILLLCDNDFGPFIVQDLKNSGAEVTESCRLSADVTIARALDAVIVAMKPRRGTRSFTPADARLLSQKAPGAVSVQYWGDVDRAMLAAAGVRVWPAERAPLPVTWASFRPQWDRSRSSGCRQAGSRSARYWQRVSSDTSPGGPRFRPGTLRRCSAEDDRKIMDTVLLLGMGPTALSALESLAANFRVAGLFRDARSSPEGGDEVVERARARSQCRCFRI